MRECSIDGCSKAHRARGLCASHYNQAHQPNRHAKVEVACAHCGEPCLKERSSRRPRQFCSFDCRDLWRFAETRASKRQVALLAPRPRLARLIEAALSSKPPTRARTWVAGKCRVCAMSFVCKWGSATCSAACQAIHYRDLKREAHHRRRALARNAYRAPVNRHEVFALAGHECMLCGTPMEMDKSVPHPLAPTIDHIVPLARGGTHEPANVQAAHFLCNATKSDMRFEELAA